jgi:hypothetical protein
MYETCAVRPSADLAFENEESFGLQVFQIALMLGALVAAGYLKGVI